MELRGPLDVSRHFISTKPELAGGILKKNIETFMWMDEYTRICPEHREHFPSSRKRRNSCCNSEVSTSGDDADKSEGLSESKQRSNGRTDGPERDEIYWERRRRNNLAAKRSRDAKRSREMDNHRKATYLEAENSKLREELSILREENARLKDVLHDAGSSLSSCLLNLTSSVVNLSHK